VFLILSILSVAPASWAQGKPVLAAVDAVTHGNTRDSPLEHNCRIGVAPLPAAGRIPGASFVLDGLAYLGGGAAYTSGRTSPRFLDSWKHDPASDSWARLADLTAGQSPKAVVVGNRAFRRGSAHRLRRALLRVPSRYGHLGGARALAYVVEHKVHDKSCWLFTDATVCLYVP
jgi:hypothetical protein